MAEYLKLTEAYIIFLEIFPDCDEIEREYIVWEETGFPCFWDSKFGNTPQECFRNQLLRFRNVNKTEI